MCRMIGCDFLGTMIWRNTNQNLWRYVSDDWLGFLGDSDLPQHEAKNEDLFQRCGSRDGDCPQHEAKIMALFER